MPKQEKNFECSSKQKEILDLEKKYFSILERIFTSHEFLDDLLLIEKEIRENYPKFVSTWNLKNKIKVPAERLVRHHLYTSMKNEICGIYPSPISSDVGIMTKDCILCVDVKTVDTVGNSVDIKSTQVEPNQISFQNSKHKYVTTSSNLESIDHYSRRPVLTYVIKIIYTDDNYSFKLSREEEPSLVLACIPNGELSKLFGNDIIKNFKTYNYYTATDNSDFEPVFIPNHYTTQEQKAWFVSDYCCNQKGYAEVLIASDKKEKPAYYDQINRCIWWQTSENNKPAIKAVKSGSTARLENEILRDRYDSDNKPWYGYKEFPIPKEL